MDTFQTPPARGGRSSYQSAVVRPPAPPQPLRTECRMAAAETCLMSDLCQSGHDRIHQAFATHSPARRVIRRGEALYRAGDTLVNLYQLYAGSVKLRLINFAGVEQIVSFPMASALLGLDGIETGTYACDAIALEDSLVCILPFPELLANSSHNPLKTLSLNRAIAQETNRYRHLLMVLACMNSEERVASFLLDLSDRMAANGYSPREFTLKMTREDIARYLGMKLETVSRIFTRLKTARVLDVHRRRLSIRDPDTLRRIGAGH